MSKFLALRVPDKDRELLIKVCQARGEDLSVFVRRAIKRELARLSFGSEFEKKCLEVSNDRNEQQTASQSSD